MSKIGHILTLLASLLITLPGHAETLEEAWVIAISTDQSLQAVHSQTMAREAGLAAARSNRLPVFKLSTSFTQLDDTPEINIGQLGLPVPIVIPNTFSHDNYVAATAQLSMPLYTSGLISDGIDAALFCRCELWNIA